MCQLPTQMDQLCHVFLLLTYHRAHNGLSLGPSSLLRHTLLSRTDYDSYTHVADSILVLLLVVLATCDSD
jgi:hypothetical protein